MLTFRNCELKNANDEIGHRKVVIFGVGSYYEILQQTVLSKLVSDVQYVIDHNYKKTYIDFCGKSIPLYSPNALRDEEDCVVILTSPVYMYDMYLQLENMYLKGKIDCYAFPFMQMVERPCMKDELVKNIYNETESSIPRIIHSFWFSGEEKPSEYKRCVDTWKLKCPNYSIIEWNKDNYDWEKNKFCKHAVEVQAWAYATDYARLDVVSRMGGFYLDMDVEILKSFDDLLNNKSLFCFSNNITIDLAVFAAQKDNDLVKELIKLYDMQDVPSTKKDYMSFFQPRFIQNKIKEYGVKSNGELQIVNDNVFLPRTFFMPMDAIIYELSALSEYTYTIHYDNFGWNAGKDNIRAKKFESNRKLWNLINK